MRTLITRISRALARARGGSVSVVGAMALPILITMTGLVAEYGNGLLQKVGDQRVADAAAFTAATQYAANSSVSVTSAADAVGALNNIPAADISAAFVSSPTGDGNQAVEVTVTTQAPLALSNVLGNHGANLTVTASSYAEVKGGAPGCIIALSGSGTGVTMNGGTSVSAGSCAVASEASVTVPCGDTMTTEAVDYDTTAPAVGCNGIVTSSGSTPPINKTSVSDPLAGNSAVAAAVGRLTNVAALTSPSAPSVVTGPAVTPGYTATDTPAVTGCTDSTYTAYSATHNWVCTGNGPFDFGALTINGGITFTVTVTGDTATPVFNITSITMSGTSLSLPAGAYNIPGGIENSSGTTTFGAGTFNFGAGAFSCNSSSGYSICNTGASLAFGGPSTFVLTGGVYNGGGETMTLGSGKTNSFDIGAAADGNSFAQGGGATTTFADATGSGDIFEMAGNLNVASGGGSCLTVSAASEHDIEGYFASAGGSTLGAGVYTIDGYLALGNNGEGGVVTCGGASVSLYADNVTLVIGGATTPGSGTCKGLAFCIAAGYSGMTLLAPTTGTTANLAVIGPLSGSEGATLAEGASGADFSGAFYFPTAAITMSGGTSLGSFGSSQCLMLIAAEVTLSGGSALASSCSGLGVASGASILVVK